MAGISAELLVQLRNTLLSCGPSFGSDETLAACFVDARITMWRNHLPVANSQIERVDKVISFLAGRFNSQGENALILFLQVLRDMMDVGDSCHSTLDNLAIRLRVHLSDQELAQPDKQSIIKQGEGIDSFSAYENGLVKLLRLIDKDHNYYLPLLTYQQRLQENIARTRRFGHTENLRTERAEIIAQLNELALSALNLSFNELCSNADSQNEKPLHEESNLFLESHQKLSFLALSNLIQRAKKEDWSLLDLSGRGLTSLPSEIGTLINLERLDLKDNLLEQLPQEMVQLHNLVRLDLRFNPLLPIPPEILERVNEPTTILDYYFESQNSVSEQRPVNEAKIILVGQGGVGKTSLIKRLIDNEFDAYEQKTNGIDVKRWYLSVNNENMCLNVWDFGGQEIMHATHQFFLTRRSIYLLVIDARKGEQESNIEYWLKLIQSFGEESPVLIIINKIDEQPLGLNRRGLQEKYPNIKNFINTSCKDNIGITDLKHAIEREIITLPHIRIPWLKSWFLIKQRLEKMKQDFISYDTYRNMCSEIGINNERDQSTLIDYLHDLGVVLNYRDDPRLEETSILNPEWVTNAVYKILNNHILFHNKGILTRQLLSEILDHEQYPSYKHDFITGLMQKFELCFTLDAGFEKKYLIPDLLPKEEPYFNWPKPNDCLLFQYSYHVLPSSVISRFIVRIQAYIPRNAYWRTGTILAYQNNQALVKADLEDAKITISVVGEKNTRREFLAIIRSNLDHIHRTIPRIEAKAQVSIPNYPGIAVDYQHLLTLEQLGQETFIPSGLSELINVKFLLDGVDAQKEGELRSVPTNLQILSQLRSFIASAFDEEELRDLCFDLNVAYDDLGGRGKAGNVRELIAYLERRDRLSDLFHILQESRPHIDWPQI